jgi:shikimate 5-dehydrogenase
VELFARNPASASSLAEEFGVTVMPIASLLSSKARVLINTTPVGMRGHSEGVSAIPPNALKNRDVVYDLVYNPLETRLLSDAVAAGCQTVSGIEMLIAQAGLQFELWTGKKPPLDKMRNEAFARVMRDT